MQNVHYLIDLVQILGRAVELHAPFPVVFAVVLGVLSDRKWHGYFNSVSLISTVSSNDSKSQSQLRPLAETNMFTRSPFVTPRSVTSTLPFTGFIETSSAG